MDVIKIPNLYGYANSYIVTNDGKHGILIDCATPEVFSVCEDKGIEIVAILLTHGHFDHVSGCRAFAENHVKIYCGDREKDLVFSKEYLGIFGGVNVPRFDINRTLCDGEELEVCGLNIKVLSTSGHTVGSVCYIIGDCLFTGDTLFCGSVGRWDLPTGNYSVLFESLEKLKNLKGDYKIYCGHGEDTTLNHERLVNPYLRDTNA